jgi:glucokinase
MAFSIGVDLGGTNLRIAAVDEHGKMLEKITTGTDVRRERDQVIAEMCDAVRSLTSRAAAAGPLHGIGIGVPGIIDMRSGLLRESPNLPGWHDYPVRDRIEENLGATVVLENDANAAALGEFWLGAARDVSSMCMITLGTGVGGGLVLDGEIWRGMAGMAGEIGHTTVEPEGPPCGCGSRGCLEQFASATAIVRMAREAIAGGSAPGLALAAGQTPEFSARMIYQMALEGDHAAQRIFDIAGRALGIVIAALVNVFNLPMYVVGGGVASAWQVFSPALLNEVRRRSFVYQVTAAEGAPVHGTHTIITRALLASDAGLYGAARLPWIRQVKSKNTKSH